MEEVLKNFLHYKTDDLFVLKMIKESENGKMSFETYKKTKRFLRTQMNRKTVYLKDKEAKEKGFWRIENNEVVFADFLVLENEEDYNFLLSQNEKHLYKFFVFLKNQLKTTNRFKLADFSRFLCYSRLERFYPRERYFMFLLEEEKKFFFTQISPRVFLFSEKQKLRKPILTLKKKKFRAKNNFVFSGKQDFYAFPADEDSFFYEKAFDTIMFARILTLEKTFLTPKEFSELKHFPNRSQTTNERNLGKMFDARIITFDPSSQTFHLSLNFTPNVLLPRTLVERLINENHREVLRDAARCARAVFPDSLAPLASPHP